MTDDKLKQDAQGLLAKCMTAKRINRPPQPKPESIPSTITGLITLYQAFSAIGRDQFEEAWKGTEVDAVSSTEVEEMTAHLDGVEKVKLERKEAQRIWEEQNQKENILWKINGQEAAVDLVRTMLPKPDDESSKRRDAAWTKLWVWFYAGTLPIYTFSNEWLKLIPMDPKQWGQEKAYKIFSRGRVAAPTSRGGGGWVVVKEDELAEALMFGEEASVPLSESAEPSVEERQPTSETADAENEEPTPLDNVQPKRNHDVGEDAILRNSIESVIAAAKTKWGDGKKQSFRGMSEVLVKDKPGRKFMGLGESAIRQILAGRYKPAKRLGISGL